ncbi:hypothetical protein CGCA056_v001388 [Colletotrichum aenigma]|uniref:uncharacterized protein n=1 Tax=Colletotrichum aenigma TaxID=1215731 RepID=UPI0018729A90|nr:uncharacterized protein CGCA056_v001388 [Colletotrichum aenigma]KAF5527305.1 hypothetical protein CGCA056_v001388 [Colletotrichum aenigma]
MQALHVGARKTLGLPLWTTTAECSGSSATREGHWRSETPTEARYSKVINHVKISGPSSSKLAYPRRALSACFEVSIGQR